MPAGFVYWDLYLTEAQSRGERNMGRVDRRNYDLWCVAVPPPWLCASVRCKAAVHFQA